MTLSNVFISVFNNCLFYSYFIVDWCLLVSWIRFGPHIREMLIKKKKNPVKQSSQSWPFLANSFCSNSKKPHQSCFLDCSNEGINTPSLFPQWVIHVKESAATCVCSDREVTPAPAPRGPALSKAATLNAMLVWKQLFISSVCFEKMQEIVF